MLCQLLNASMKTGCQLSPEGNKPVAAFGSTWEQEVKYVTLQMECEKKDLIPSYG